jgi:hypothetical protein
VPHAAQQFDIVNLEALAWPASISKATTREFSLNVFDSDPKSSRKPFHHHHERLPVTFTRREIPQHRLRLPPSQFGLSGCAHCVCICLDTKPFSLL